MSSGTTGAPKGALLSHRNIVSTVVSVDKVVKLHAEDLHLSYLPLAHVFERCVVHTVSAHLYVKVAKHLYALIQ